ncbi:hypothetical protein NQZ68_027716 [Dissostichus eleginoides]|nr:hypothetical protein NQZ68_027716 [Dissostichus eleginoides]
MWSPHSSTPNRSPAPSIRNTASELGSLPVTHSVYARPLVNSNVNHVLNPQSGDVIGACGAVGVSSSSKDCFPGVARRLGDTGWKS